MSSLTRKIAKKIAKKQGVEIVAADQLVRNMTEHGYEVCHPTKGWKKVSTLRVFAPVVVDQLKGRW